jgi:archaellum component FlaC
MEAMRQSWTDDRLDDFRGEVNRRFDMVDKRFDKVDERFDKVDGELKRLDSKIDGLQRTIMLTGGGIIAALLGIIGTIVSVAVTQL